MDKKLKLADYINYYRVFREYTMQESGLINARLTWLITLNSLLFAAAGFSLPKGLDLSSSTNAKNITIIETSSFVAVVCLLAIVVNFFGWRSIISARNVNKKLQNLFENKINESHKLTLQKDALDVDASYYTTSDGYVLPALRGGGSGRDLKRSYHVYNVIPWAFILAWIFVAILVGGVSYQYYLEGVVAKNPTVSGDGKSQK